jgi:hypothetical protein
MSAGGISSPQAVVAEPFCQAYMPLAVADAQGFTFIGRLVAQVGHRPRSARDHDVRRLIFHVQEVLADHGYPKSGNRMILRAGSPSTLFDEGCDRLYGFHVGARYLVSTSSLLSPVAGQTVAWQLDGRSAHVVVMYPQHDSASFRGFAAADTLGKALALMVPGDLPPTEMVTPVDEGAPMSDGQPATALFVAAAALGGFVAGSSVRRGIRKN